MREVRGVPYAFFETGTEGVMWSVLEDGKSGYDALNIIEEGDHLTIYANDEKETVMFSGLIVEDVETGLYSHPQNPRYKQQVALGMWIHWVQEGWEPDQWAELFMKDGKYRAVLLTAKKRPLPF